MSTAEDSYETARDRILDGITKAQEEERDAANAKADHEIDEVRRVNELETEKAEIEGDLDLLQPDEDDEDAVDPVEDLGYDEDELEEEVEELGDRLDEVEAELSTIRDANKQSKFDRRKQRAEQRRQEAQKKAVRRRRKLEAVIERHRGAPDFGDEEEFDEYVADLIENHEPDDEDEGDDGEGGENQDD